MAKIRRGGEINKKTERVKEECSVKGHHAKNLTTPKLIYLISFI
jgi:hypothetical protein